MTKAFCAPELGQRGGLARPPPTCANILGTGHIFYAVCCFSLPVELCVFSATKLALWRHAPSGGIRPIITGIIGLQHVQRKQVAKKYKRI